MKPPSTQERGSGLSARFGGAWGAGVVLVLLPSLALFAGMEWIENNPTVGLPVLAVFGIMILFGAMALVSTLFARLQLADRHEALALPPGSVRAAIALALIVLFAIIVIMLFQSLSAPHRVRGLSEADKAAIVAEPRNQIIAVLPDDRCPPAPGPARAGAAACWQVHMARPPGHEATDIAKQLLVLVGTLVTSVTSYYFAARTAEPNSGWREQPTAPAPQAHRAPSPSPSPPSPSDSTGPAPQLQGALSADDQVEPGEPVRAAEATPDEALPPAVGGVA